MVFTEVLTQVFTVERIMTPRSAFLLWTGHGDIESLWHKAHELNIDTIPMVENDKIERVLSRGSDQPKKIMPNQYVPQDRSVFEALELFADLPESRKIFVTFHDTVVGIVTSADLNRVIVRTYLYNLLAELEMILARHIRAYFHNNQKAILHILKQSSDNEFFEDLAQSIKEQESQDLEIDIVHLLYLKDLVKVVSRSKPLLTTLGFSSSTKFSKAMNKLVALRNDVMHPVKLLVGNNRSVEQLFEQAKLAADLVDRWNALPTSQQ